MTPVEALASGKAVIALPRGGVLETYPPRNASAEFFTRTPRPVSWPARWRSSSATRLRSPSSSPTMGARSSPRPVSIKMAAILRQIDDRGVGKSAFPPRAPFVPTSGSRDTLSRKVVFFFPAFSSQEATAPLGILAVSTPLLRAGYEVRIIDSTITPDFKRRMIDELKDALCLAVSLVTGPMIRETVEIVSESKRRYPGLPVILGGWHPSLLPDQTLAADCVDMIVIGQGEDAFLEVVQQSKRVNCRVSILVSDTRTRGRLVFNPRRPFRPIRRDSPEGLSSGGLRRIPACLRPTLGNVYEQSRLSLQLRVLHQRWCVRPKMERAAS